jgi:hypothetical protein
MLGNDGVGSRGTEIPVQRLKDWVEKRSLVASQCWARFHSGRVPARKEGGAA